MPWRRNLDPDRLLASRQRKNLDVERLTAFSRNPDPTGQPWGPSLYDPLGDNDHNFKDESHYKKIISKLRRNPYRRLRRNYDEGLYDSIYSRNPGWSFREGRATPHEQEMSEMYHRVPRRASRRWGRQKRASSRRSRLRRTSTSPRLGSLRRNPVSPGSYQRPRWSGGRRWRHRRRMPRHRSRPRYRRNPWWEATKAKARQAARVTGRTLKEEGAEMMHSAGEKLREWGDAPEASIRPRRRRYRRRNPGGLFGKPNEGLFSSIYSRRRNP